MNSKRVVWKPVERGYEYHCQCVDCMDGEDRPWQHKIYVNGNEIGVCYTDGSDESNYIHAPDNLRLCQAELVDDAPAVTVTPTLLDALETLLAIVDCDLYSYDGTDMQVPANAAYQLWQKVYDKMAASLEGGDSDD